MPPETGVIEFLPPDERAFGGADGASTTFVGFDRDGFDGGGFGRHGGFDLGDGADEAEAPRSRWLPAIASLAVAGLLVGGVVAAAPWSGDDAAPAPSSTLPAPSTSALTPAPLSTATVAPLDPSDTGWLLDPVPDGLRPAFFARDEDRLDEADGWGEVWAEPGATRTSGRWFSLTLLPFREFDTDMPTWFAVEVAGRPGFASVDPDGVVSLAYDLGQSDAARLVTIEAGGMGLAAMIELAESIAIVDDRPQMVDDRPDFTVPELLGSMYQVASGATDTDFTTRLILGGPPRTSAFYSGPGRSDITVVQEQPTDLLPYAADVDTLAALAVATIAVADGWGPKGDFAGDGLTIGRRSLGGYDLLVARWIEGDPGTSDEQVVSLISTGDLSEVLGMLPAVHLASAEEWAVAGRSAAAADRPFESDPRLPPGLTIGDGSLADGTPWSVLDWASSDEWEVRVGTAGAAVPRASTTSVTPLTVGDATLVVVHTDVVGATARLVAADGVVRDVMLSATDRAGRASSTGVIALESTTPFAVEISGPDGALAYRVAPWEPIVISGGTP